MQGTVGAINEEDLYYGILWGLVTAIRGGQTGTIDMYYGRPGLDQFGCPPALRAYEAVGMRTAFGLVSRDQNIYVHEGNERFLARLPPELADEIRQSPMGYAWPVGDVMATFEGLVDEWHERDGRIRIVTAPDWTPACSDELYVRCRKAADEHGTGLITHALETRSEMLFRPRRADSRDSLGALRVGDGRRAPHLCRLRCCRIEQPRLEPQAGQRHLPHARHHGCRRACGVRYRRHLVLGSGRLFPRAPSGGLPTAVAADIRGGSTEQ